MRVLLADDHRLLVEGLSNLLAAHGIEVVGIANDGLEAVAMAEQLSPDLILMDIRMPRCDGLSATRQIKARRPELEIVMLTTSAEEQDLFEAVKSGAAGYLLKSMSGDAFIEALMGLQQGVPPFSPGLAARLLSEFARLGRAEEPVQRDNAEDKGTAPEEVLAAGALTERQLEVLRLVADGLTYREVGERLYLSERTVRFHMAEIIDRLHLENRSQVLAYAGKLGLKPPD
jgi:DNA-binding NarL/FixJ family response regulator